MTWRVSVRVIVFGGIRRLDLAGLAIARMVLPGA